MDMDYNELNSWLQSACNDLEGGNSDDYYEDHETLRELVGDNTIHMGDRVQDLWLETWERTYHKPLKIAMAGLLLDHFGFDVNSI